MKKFIFLFVLIFSLIACSNEERKINDNKQSIIGTWQLVENYGSDGDNFPHWFPIGNGYTYTFRENGTISSSRFSCQGTFDFNHSDNITIDFNCSGVSYNGTFDILFQNNYLILTPNPSPCDEGCAKKFHKLNH